jgi:hypothetical protein
LVPFLVLKAHPLVPLQALLRGHIFVHQLPFQLVDLNLFFLRVLLRADGLLVAVRPGVLRGLLALEQLVLERHVLLFQPFELDAELLFRLRLVVVPLVFERLNLGQVRLRLVPLAVELGAELLQVLFDLGLPARHACQLRFHDATELLDVLLLVGDQLLARKLVSLQAHQPIIILRSGWIEKEKGRRCRRQEMATRNTKLGGDGGGKGKRVARGANMPQR